MASEIEEAEARVAQLEHMLGHADAAKNEALESNDKLRGVNNQLRDALLKYGAHEPNCLRAGAACGCGFAAALTVALRES